jgi:hypothetical protein
MYYLFYARQGQGLSAFLAASLSHIFISPGNASSSLTMRTLRILSYPVKMCTLRKLFVSTDHMQCSKYPMNMCTL